MHDSVLTAVKDFARHSMTVGGDFRHNWDHIERVAESARQAVDRLHLPAEFDITIQMAACYLHDLPAVRHAFSIPNYFRESAFAARYMPGILDTFPLSAEEKDQILRAIVAHPLSIPWRRLNRKADWYTRILQDADSLDYFSYAREEKWIENLKQTKWRILFPLFRLYMRTGRRCIRFFLNIPELAGLQA